jgi:hypothetical protein
MSRVVLGKSGNKNVELDLDTLLRTRLLIQANSGGGKSWLLRRLAEQLFGKIPVIIIDPEGEFATLREKFGYVLVGKGGETPADPRSASLLAHKLLELRASAVCDLYELKPSERHHWVRLFLEAMIDAPKKLWRPTIVVVDEAHTFCPEKGAGESEASDAMTSLPTRGRKRRFCAVWATQRLGKLRKDASAELLNRMIGPTFEDVDLKRAADLLSIRSEDRREFDQQMRVLEPGHFFALGRAISKERILVTVGNVETSHEIEDSKYGVEAPPPPEKVQALLPKLADLPKAAEEKAKTEAELRAEIRSLKAQLRAQPAKTETKTVAVADPRAVDRAVHAAEHQAQKQIATIHASRKKLLAKGSDFARALAKLAEAAAKAFTDDQAKSMPVNLTINREAFLREGKGIVPAAVKQEVPRLAAGAPPSEPAKIYGEENISAPQMKLLTCLAEMEAIGRPQVDKKHLAAMAGVSHKSGGGYQNNLGRLRTLGLIAYPTPGQVSLTDQGRAMAPAQNVPSDANEMLARCLAVVSAPQGKILSTLFEIHPEAISKVDLAERVGVSPDSGGGYQNNLGALRSAGMIEYPGPGMVRCADWLFIE